MYCQTIYKHEKITLKKMITLLGTGHIFNLQTALQQIFDEKQPDAICVELDKQRYQALLLKRNNPEAYKHVSRNVPIMYKLFAQFQENMAKEYGVEAGSEMLAAINYAQSHQLRLEFIDVNAQKLFTKMLKTMSFSEKLKLFISGFGGIFVGKKRIESELKKIDNNYDSYIKQIGQRFPTIKRVLIDERNEHMTKKILQLTDDHKKIMVCIGDGHVPGISNILKLHKVDFETIRLQELRKIKIEPSDTSTASFSMEYKGF